MRALRELRGPPPRTADGSYERGSAPHPEYAGGGVAMALLYPDRATLQPQPGPLGTPGPPPSRRGAAHPEYDTRSDASSLLYPDKSPRAPPGGRDGRSQLLRLRTPPPAQAQQAQQAQAQRRQWRQPSPALTPAPRHGLCAPSGKPLLDRPGDGGEEAAGTKRPRCQPAPPGAPPPAGAMASLCALAAGSTPASASCMHASDLDELVETQEHVIASQRTQLSALAAVLQQGVRVPLAEGGAVHVRFENGWEWRREGGHDRAPPTHAEADAHPRWEGEWREGQALAGGWRRASSHASTADLVGRGWRMAGQAAAGSRRGGGWPAA